MTGAAEDTKAMQTIQNATYPLTIPYFFSILLYEIDNQDTVRFKGAHLFGTSEEERRKPGSDRTTSEDTTEIP